MQEVHLHDGTDNLIGGMTPLVSLGQGDYRRDYTPAAAAGSAGRFELLRRLGRFDRWRPWRRAGDFWSAEEAARLRCRETGESVAVVDTEAAAGSGVVPRRVEWVPGSPAAPEPRRLVVVQ